MNTKHYLVGSTITAVSEDPSEYLQLVAADGRIFYLCPSRDEEGNGAGRLFEYDEDEIEELEEFINDY